MAELVAGFLGPAIVVVKWFGAPIVRQFNYLCCFATNMKNLKDEAEKLDDAAGEVQVRVDRAAEDVQVIVPRVETWLAKSNDIKGQKNTILDEVPNVGSGCLKLGARFSLSRRAKKAADRMKELVSECKFDVVALPGPPAASEAVPLGKTYEFESRKQIEEDIMAILRGGDLRVIGICGMGGLGKTTMAKKIMNRVLKERVFEETVIAVVSQQVKKHDIQREIGGSLGVNLDAGTPEAVRVQKLRARLSGTKRILLVLDDIWEGVELEEFGIPRDSEGCTILITSRNRDALRATGVQKEFGMEILSDDEAWFLFRESAGTCVDDNKLKSIAEGVVKECEGLPIAIATVGAALKNEKNPSIWEDARHQLSRCDPDIPYFIAKVYNPLKLSYDFLSSKQAKSVFLLCCLFPEDADIDVQLLTYFGMGVGIFEGINNLEEARNRMSMLITILKSRSLLLDNKRKDHVRMHDVVRDVCIFIVKREGCVGGNDCIWISSFELLGETSKHSTGLRFPNLRLLFLNSYHYTDLVKEEFKFDIAFFEEIRNLYVLCIQNYDSLTSLPQATNSLKNLKNLVLDSCVKLESISVVGEFVNLEIFICRHCYLIEELPSEIKRLNRLKLLELAYCSKLKRIGRDIISSLVGLEELKMLRSFNKWETEDREERENAGLRELEALTNLRWLEIEIEDPALASQKLHLPSKMKRFDIIISPSHSVPGTFPYQLYDKSMVLELKKEETCLANWIEMRLLRDTEYLNLSGNGANRVDLVKCQNIRRLELVECESMKNIVTTSVVDDDTAFPASLEHLDLFSLPKLEGICDGPILSTSFNNLKSLRLIRLAALKQLWKSNSESNYVPPLFSYLSSIQIYNCPCLHNLDQLSIAGKYCLPQLQSLSIQSCDMMERVFLCNEDDENSESRNHRVITKVFPKLKEVDLGYLPNMTTFYQGIGGIEFPLLKSLSIIKCPKLKSMVGSDHNSGGSSSDIDDDSSNFLCEPKKVSFGNLKKLQIDQRNPFCGHKIPLSLLNGLEELTFYTLQGMSLFSYSVATNLVNLRVLNIRKCDVMLKLIEDIKEEKVVSCGEMALLFPKLEELQLEDLPKLVTFCEWKCDVKLPSLKKVVIIRCPDMENFCLGILAAPKLEGFTTDVNNNLDIGVNVSFFNLERLEITKSEKPFYGHKFFISLSYGLKELKVYRCHSMSCVFTSSITRNLDRLEVLIIDECNEMVKVIEDEGMEEKVASGGERRLLFPKLKKLRLSSLPLMVSFCEWKCDIELPSLKNVVIWGCPVLKNFTMGSIATAPNLENVEIDYIVYDGTKDLNIALQQHLARVKEREEKAKKKQGRGEEEEIKGEIEEVLQ